MLDQVAHMEQLSERAPTKTGGHSQVEDADVHASSAEYAQRFAGGVGAWMLTLQKEALLSMVSNETESVLDVGGGHGQTARPLYQVGKSVTVIGSSPSCAGQLSSEIEAGVVSFKCGNLIQLPYGQRSFDVVVSFRLMSHCSAWRTLIAEMCRVADHTVIFDYPSWVSGNFLTPLFFRIKRGIEGNTRRYRIFTTTELRREFSKHGFTCTALRKQFFFPMGIHRALRLPLVSKMLEGCATLLGLTRLFGSPVIIRFERIARDK
jgi:2-polyprenyl-3-methyl-5-hydroxy-6-metoxy-1,4-benzoquinol methylase